MPTAPGSGQRALETGRGILVGLGAGVGFRKLAEAGLEVCLRGTPLSARRRPGAFGIPSWWSWWEDGVPTGEEGRLHWGAPSSQRAGIRRRGAARGDQCSSALRAREAGPMGLDRPVPIPDPDLLSLVPHLSGG